MNGLGDTLQGNIIIFNFRAATYPQGLYMAKALADAGFKVTYCAYAVPAFFGQVSLANIALGKIPHLSTSVDSKFQYIMNLLYSLIMGFKGYDVAIGVDAGFLPALLLKVFKRVNRLVAYFLEYGSPVTAPSSIGQKLTKYLGNYCDALVDVEVHRLKMRKSWMASSAREFVVKNAPPLFSVDNGKRKPFDLSQGLRVLFIGNLTEVTCIDQLVHAVSLCDIPIKLFILGRSTVTYFRDLQSKYADSFHSGKVVYLGFQDKKVLGKYLKNCHVGIVFYKKSNINAIYCDPNKLYECISHGLPVICSDNLPLKIIEKEGMGICVDPDNITEIASSLKRVYYDKEYLQIMSRNCLDLFYRKYNYECQLSKFILYLKR